MKIDKIIFHSNSKNISEIFKKINSFNEIWNLSLSFFKEEKKFNVKTNHKNDLFFMIQHYNDIKKSIIRNQFFAYYEDSYRKLINLNIDWIMNNNYEKYNFKIKNDETYTLKMPSENAKFSILKNSTYHKNFNKEIKGWDKDWDTWILKASSKISFFINDVEIENFKGKIIEIIKKTNLATLKLYKERSKWNHSFENWINKNKENNLKNIFEIYYLFFLVNLNLIIFDLYINDVWKPKRINKKYFKPKILELKNNFILNSDEFLQKISNDFFNNSPENTEKIISLDKLEFKILWKNNSNKS